METHTRLIAFLMRARRAGAPDPTYAVTASFPTLMEAPLTEFK
jgi:hypothetical protein